MAYKIIREAGTCTWQHGRHNGVSGPGADGHTVRCPHGCIFLYSLHDQLQGLGTVFGNIQLARVAHCVKRKRTRIGSDHGEACVALEVHHIEQSVRRSGLTAGERPPERITSTRAFAPLRVATEPHSLTA